MRALAAAAALLCVTAVLGTAAPASARDLWTSDDYQRSVVLQSALKSTYLLSRAPDDPILFPDRTSADNLWRLRFTLTADATTWLTAKVANELRSTLSSTTGGAFGLAILPSSARAPYRIRQLNWALIDQQHLSMYDEIDRASLAFHLPFGDITVGRQPIGYGRGVLFSAVDVFAPFSPLEVDREWRRGVDAVHAEVRLSEHFSTDAAAGFGPTIDQSAFIGRVRGFAGNVDGSLMFGRRATDWMLAATSSATVGDAAIYGEAAWFDTKGNGIDGGWFGSSRWVAKFVAGGSYMFDVGQGLKVVGEYHYSGFGLRHVSDATTLLAQPDFAERFVRGDTQILGRHAFALVLSYDPFTDLTATLTTLVSPVDGSGLVSPGLKWVVSDRVTLQALGFFPWGAAPRGGVFRSEWGVTPITAYVQMSFYD